MLRSTVSVQLLGANVPSLKMTAASARAATSATTATKPQMNRELTNFPSARLNAFPESGNGGTRVTTAPFRPPGETAEEHYAGAGGRRGRGGGAGKLGRLVDIRPRLEDIADKYKRSAESAGECERPA